MITAVQKAQRRCKKLTELQACACSLFKFAALSANFCIGLSACTDRISTYQLCAKAEFHCSNALIVTSAGWPTLSPGVSEAWGRKPDFDTMCLSARIA